MSEEEELSYFKQKLEKAKNQDLENKIKIIRELEKLRNPLSKQPLHEFLLSEIRNLDQGTPIEAIQTYYEFYMWSNELEELSNWLTEGISALYNITDDNYDIEELAKNLGEVTEKALEELGNLKDDSAVDIIKKLNQWYPKRNWDNYVQMAAIEYLGKIGGIDSQFLLSTIVQDEEEDLSFKIHAAKTHLERYGAYPCEISLFLKEFPENQWLDLLISLLEKSLKRLENKENRYCDDEEDAIIILNELVEQDKIKEKDKEKVIKVLKPYVEIKYCEDCSIEVLLKLLGEEFVDEALKFVRKALNNEPRVVYQGREILNQIKREYKHKADEFYESLFSDIKAGGEKGNDALWCLIYADVKREYKEEYEVLKLIALYGDNNMIYAMTDTVKAITKGIDESL